MYSCVIFKVMSEIEMNGGSSPMTFGPSSYLLIEFMLNVRERKL